MSLWQNIKKKSKNYFLSGILFFVPLVITIVVIKAIFTFLDNLLFPYLQPYFGYWLPGIGILIILGMILLTGMVVTNYMGRKFFQFGENMVLNIPLVKSIYGSVKQILQTFSGQDKQLSKKVVLVEYPKENVWSVGLVNGEVLHPQTREEMCSILIIAAINPASGFFIMVPKEKVVMLDISVEEAMKWIVSGGIITPDSFKHFQTRLK
jgi:uncharacterized membrane protein